MYLLENVFTNEHGEAITVLQLLTKFKMTLSEIDKYLNEYGNRLNSIEFLNVTQQQEINILKTQVQTLQTNVSNLQLTVGDYLLRFVDLDVQLAIINGKITNNTTDISSLNVLVSSIQTSITNINNQINTINLQIAGINTRLDLAFSSISDLNDSVDTINTTLTSHTSSITSITTSVNDLTTLVNSIQNTCTTLTTDLNLLTSRVAYLETNDTWQNGQISSLTTSTQLNTSNVSALNILVDGLDDRVDDLELLGSENCGKLYSNSNLLGLKTAIPVNTYVKLWDFPLNVDTPKRGYRLSTHFTMANINSPRQILLKTPAGIKTILLPTGTQTTIYRLDVTFIYLISAGNLEYVMTVDVTSELAGRHECISSAGVYLDSTVQAYPLQYDALEISSNNSLFLQSHILENVYNMVEI